VVELLGVAAADGLRHLMSDQLAGPHMVPVEAVRLMLAWGAQTVQVTIGRKGFEVHGHGAGMPGEAAELWHRASSVSAAALDAMTSVEDRGWQLLLWGIGSGAIGIVVAEPGGARFRWGATASLHRPAAGGDGGTTVRMAMRLSRERARRAVLRSCRHASRAVLLEGRDVREPLRGGAFRVHLRSPVPAEVMLGVEDPVARVTLLRHGVVAARVSVPGGWPPMAAAVDITNLTSDPCAAADCRDAVRPVLRALAEAAVGAGLGVADRLPGLGPAARRRMVSLFVTAAGEGIQAERIRRTPVLPLRLDGDLHMVSIQEVMDADGRLRRAATGAAHGDGLLLEPDDAALLEVLVGRDLAPQRSWPAMVEGGGWRRCGAILRSRLLRIPSDRYTRAEARVADALPWVVHGDAPGVQVSLMLVKGSLPPVRTGPATVVLGRDGGAMRRAVAVLERTNDSRLAALAVIPPGFRVRLTA
jgi:hypothetical protein